MPSRDLFSFGFPPDLVQTALEKNDNDFERALDWILEQKAIQTHPYLSEQESQSNEEHTDFTRMLSADSKDKLLLYEALNPGASERAFTLLKNIAQAHRDKQITSDEKSQLHILMIEQNNIESTQRQLDHLKKQHEDRLRQERQQPNPIAFFPEAHPLLSHLLGPNPIFPFQIPFPIVREDSDNFYDYEHTSSQQSAENQINAQSDWRDVIDDQDQQYFEALLKDQEMERQKQEELRQKQEELRQKEEELKRKEEEEKIYQQEQERLIENRKREIEEKKSKFLQEPENSADQNIRIRFQLPNLPHIDRRFSSNQTLKDIFDFIDVTLYEHQIDSKFEVVMFPKRILTEELSDKTLKELEIIESVVLRITLKE